jgi:hypothetical protein
VDVARRLCEDNQIHVSEIWSYFTVGEDVRFTLVHRSREVVQPPRAVARVAMPRPAAKAKPSLPKRRAAVARSGRGKPAARAKAAKKPARTQKRK